MDTFTEAAAESDALAWLAKLGWQILHYPNIAPSESAAKRDDYG